MTVLEIVLLSYIVMMILYVVWSMSVSKMDNKMMLPETFRAVILLVLIQPIGVILAAIVTLKHGRR